MMGIKGIGDEGRESDGKESESDGKERESDGKESERPNCPCRLRMIRKSEVQKNGDVTYFWLRHQ